MKKKPQNIYLSQLNSLTQHQLDLFKTKGVSTLEDILTYYPMRYEDRHSTLSLTEAINKQTQNEHYIPTIIAECTNKREFNFRGKLLPQFIFKTQNEMFSITSFNPYHRYLKEGGHYILTGKLKLTGKKVVMNLIEYEAFDEDALQSINMGRIVPIYSSTEGLFQKKIRQTISKVLSVRRELDYNYNLPKHLIEKYQMKPILDNIYQLHFPDNFESLQESKSQLIYNELFAFQYELAQKKINAKKEKEPLRYERSIIETSVIKKLPFELNQDQINVLNEIKEDMRATAVMTRMIQGDVGSGKTVIALLSMLLAHDNQHQSALLVPTDILARQHYQLFFNLLLPFGINVVLLVSKMKASIKKEAIRQIRTGEAHIIIGTHSIFQEDISYFNLKYIVIDEQHRFGVDQRQQLIEKGQKPDILMMTATPIPRSLSMTIFGDLDISSIKTLPHGMGNRKSKILYEDEKNHAYQFLLSRVKKGEQGYVVFPAIEEEKSHGLKSLLKESKRIIKEFFPTYPVGILHGKLSDDEKQNTMKLFMDKQISIIFTTTVIEVGINNPNATTIIIESSEQFGLSQLHQLRGRVGRGELEGYCYLLTKRTINLNIKEKLKKFCITDDGFKISELDLEMRGTGDFFGTKQSGKFKFKLADIIRDFEILKKAKTDAQDCIIESYGPSKNNFFH